MKEVYYYNYICGSIPINRCFQAVLVIKYDTTAINYFAERNRAVHSEIRCCPFSNMKKNSDNIKDNDTIEAIIGEVLTEQEAEEKKAAIAKRNDRNLIFGSYITKSNDLIQKTKYSLPRNEQKILFMLLSKIDQKRDTDASKYYTITFSEFSKLTGVNAMDSSYIKYLQETVNSLASRFFWVPNPNGTGYNQMAWILPTVEVNTKDKTIKMQFHPKIWKDIAQLTSNYTSYSIEYLLMMQSTYSMRVYEIILSYDNGDRDYGYNNGLVFEPVTEKILSKFPEKREELKGFKYKRFETDEFKSILSVPPLDEQNRSKSKKKDDPEPKYSRERTLAEKYPTFTAFENNVLKIVKKEINELTDLWFDYVPVRIKGERKYKYLYIFIKYKTKEEMRKVRAFHDSKDPDLEVPRRPRRRNKMAESQATPEMLSAPIPDSILDMTFRNARNIIRAKAEYRELEKLLSAEERNILEDIFTYTSKILTNQKKREQAEETLEALNRIIKDNNGLKTWALGMCSKFKTMFASSTERKSAQYYRTVVYNEIAENTAVTIENGKQWLNWNGTKKTFKLDMFDEGD